MTEILTGSELAHTCTNEHGTTQKMDIDAYKDIHVFLKSKNIKKVYAKGKTKGKKEKKNISLLNNTLV